MDEKFPWLWHHHRHQIISFDLWQIEFRKHKKGWRKYRMGIQGTILGATSTFQITFVPPSNTVPLQSGPTVACDDPNAVVSPVSTDGEFEFSVQIPANDTNLSYNLTISGVNGAGQPITHKFNVPILPQPAQQITDFGLNQLS